MKKISAYRSDHITATLVLFVLFNIIFLLYRMGVFGQSVYYLTLILYCLYGITSILYRKINVKVKEFRFYYGCRNILIVAFSFWVISIIEQLMNKDLQLYLYTDLLDLLLPILVSFIILNLDLKNFQNYIYIFFVRAILQFLIDQGENISVDAILSINWNDSASAATETSVAHIFCIFTIFFLFQKKKVLALISTLFCLICFKRFAFIFSLISWCICPFVPNRKMRLPSFWILSIAFIVSPIFILFIYSKQGEMFFEAILGLDLNDFTMGRYNLVNFTLNHFNGQYNGFGCIHNFFLEQGGVYAQLTSFHCDMLRIYLECTLVGVVIYVFALMDIAKKNWRIFYMLFFLFVEMIVSHFLGRFVEWTLFYLFAFYVDSHGCFFKKSMSTKFLNHKAALT